jgi:uncharacterized membrane protein
MLRKKIKRVFFTGLVVVVPAGLTLYILFFIIDIMDQLFLIIPEKYQPDVLLGFHIPGLGAISTVLLILLIGLVTTSYIGDRVVSFGERLVGKIPLVRSIYQAIKSIADSLFTDRTKSFKRVVLVEYPRLGIYSIGFVTGVPNNEIQQKLGPCLGVYFPHALTPTTGTYMIVPTDAIIDINISVEEAFTLIISTGVVNPRDRFLAPDSNGSSGK